MSKNIEETKQEVCNDNDKEIKKNIRQPAVFINHGGGPMPYLDFIKKGSSNQQFVIDSCLELGKIIEKNKPKAILIFSAHWEEDEPTLMYNKSPPMLYDYYGFPPESYKLEYNAKCDIDTTDKIFKLLKNEGFSPKLDKKRGWDHGVFIPLIIGYPKANIPLIQCSLIKVNNNKRHEIALKNIKLGSILSKLRNDGIMIIGSGMSYHNMAGFMNPKSLQISKKFSFWLNKILINNNIVDAILNLNNWFKGDNAKLCHLREEHLLPLMSCLGSCIDINILNDIINNKNIDQYKNIKLNITAKSGKVFQVICNGFVFN